MLFTSGSSTYGYAAMRAYAAYGNQSFLDYAVQSWSLGNQYTIAPDADIVIGKNVTISKECNGGEAICSGILRSGHGSFGRHDGRWNILGASLLGAHGRD